MYLLLLIATNVKLLRHHARQKTKELWKINSVDHEALLETLKVRDDPSRTLE
jgi:hypothetical protein